MDLIDDYAFPLPITVIAELLGVPAEDRNNFREWSDAAVSGNASQEYMEEILIPHMQAFTDYLRALFEEKRANPKDDLVSALVRAEEAGDRLSEDELLGMVFLLLVAGHETTVNLIGNGVLALLQHPDQLRKLKEDPSLIKPAIEELLRYDGPVETSTERFAREDVEIGDQVIPRGEMVLVVLAAADHDPERFSDPDELDITRTDNRHLAFGKGIHHCLGAARPDGGPDRHLHPAAPDAQPAAQGIARIPELAPRHDTARPERVARRVLDTKGALSPNAPLNSIESSWQASTLSLNVLKTWRS